MDTVIRALVVGIGIVGERHVRAQLKYGSHVGIYDHHAAHMAALKQKYPQIHVFHDLEEALAWATAVHICTPDHLHADIAKQAIERGRAILCEKPATTNYQEAIELSNLCKKHNTLFVVGNNNRLTPAFLEIKKRLKNRAIGDILSIRATYLHDMRKLIKQTPWRRDQDYLWGGGIHAIDLVAWMMGEEVVDMSMMLGRKVMHTYASPEDYQILLKFASGVVANIWLSARVVLPVHKVDLELYGTRGVLMAQNKSSILRSYMQPKKSAGKLHKYTHERITAGYRHTINKEIELFNKYILGAIKTPSPLPTLDEALPAIRITERLAKLLQKSML